MSSDHYSLLGLPYNATPEEIRNAYFQLVRNLHPDANPDPAVKERFLEVQKAYEVLSNLKQKAEYDASLPPDLRAGPELSVSVKYSMQAIPRFDEPQLIYALVDMVCTADLSKEKLPLSHVCLALDRSTSMQGPRMDMVKASALNLLHQLRSSDLLSVVSFSDRAEVVVPPTRASALTKSDHRISMLQTGGGTEILQGMALGMQQLRRTDASHIRHLVILTDGHTYGDEDGCIQLAREAAEEGISISVLGIGHEWNDELMDRIASLSGGNAMLISTPRDLENYLMQKLAELESVYARGLKFQFESAKDVDLHYAFRLSPSIGPLETESPILLGDVHHRHSVTFLLEFVVPPLAAEEEHYSLAKGQIWMDIPSRSAQRMRIFFDLFRPIRENVESEPPPSMVVEALSKLTLYRLQEKVRHEVGEGQIDKATRHLHYLATHLLSQGDRELAHTVLLEAEHVQQSRRFSGEGEKRIKYGTRALLLPPGSELKS
jgi:Ca-activated chloride channel family protein